jgi:hypothetical protein
MIDRIANHSTKEKSMRTSNPYKVTGTPKAIENWAAVIVAGLHGKLSKNGNPDSAKRITEYALPIIGGSNQSVTMKVVIDDRIEQGWIEVDAGWELLLWQASVKTLCAECQWARKQGNLIFCLAAYHPTPDKRECKEYRHHGNKA